MQLDNNRKTSSYIVKEQRRISAREVSRAVFRRAYIQTQAGHPEYYPIKPIF